MPTAVERVAILCEVCGNVFFRLPKEQKRPGRKVKYCSVQCRGVGMRKRVSLRCAECGGRLWRSKSEHGRRGKRAWCSRLCFRTWERKRCNSYPKIGAQHAHRLVFEKHLGRPLRSDEVIHHKDGNRLNFELSNLQLTNRAEHGRIHHLGVVRSPEYKRKMSIAIRNSVAHKAHRERNRK